MLKRVVLIGLLLITVLSGLIIYRLFFQPVKTNLIDRRDLTGAQPSPLPSWVIGPIARKLPGRIAFAANPRGQFDIFILEKGAVRPLVQSPDHESYPRFSPDGRWLAFQRKIHGQWDIFILELTTGREIPIATSRFSEENPTWCDHGRSLVFDSNQAPRRQLFRYNLQNHRLDQLTSGAISKNILAACHPERPLLAVTSNRWWGWSLGLFDPVNHHWKMLVRGHSCRPEWSPDGQKLAFVYMGWDHKGDIALFDFTTNKPMNLTPSRTHTYDYDPAWSPDGQWIVFQTTTNKKKGNWNLMVINLKSHAIEPLLTGGFLETYPHWAP